MATADPSDPYVMVAAIDFGTTFSGYAFSFKGSETDIRLNKNWGDAAGFLSYKTPTAVLLTGRDLKFEAFGYEAEAKYAEPEDEDDPDTKHLFRHFKMILHNTEKLTTKTAVWSTDGQIAPAIDIFTHAMKYLKDHLLEHISQELSRPADPDLIRWVITVPAIWSEQSKQFMREVAFRSGCIKDKDSRQLIIALEPEAGSFYCRQLDLVCFTEEGIAFPSGTRYLVLDCGGGTNDMVVHEVVLDYSIKELIAVRGGPHGGTCIEEKFVSLLKEILGEKFIQTFRKEHPDQWHSFMCKFERLKKQVKNDGKSKMSIEMPYSMEAKYAVFHSGKALNSALESKKMDGLRYASGMLVLSNQIARLLFQETINNIAYGVRKICNNPFVQPLKYIFMIGGFSESHFLQEAIKSEFGSNGCKVLVPNEAQLAVIKGAVLFAYHQDHVVSRIARMTYGIAVCRKYNPKHHDASEKVTDIRGLDFCRFFHPLVEIGDQVKLGSTVLHQTHMIPEYDVMIVRFCSLSRKPQKPYEYYSNPDVKNLGVIAIKAHRKGIQRNYTSTMKFGNTEILCTVIDETTGEMSSTTIDFLSD